MTRVLISGIALLVCLYFAIAQCFAGDLGDRVVANSQKYLRVRERTGHNDNPWIDYWAKSVGLDNKAQFQRTGTGYSWCMIFVHGVYEETAEQCRIKNPMPRAAGVQIVWSIARADELRYKTIDADDLLAGVERGEAGDVLIMLHKNGLGHTEIVRSQYRAELNTCGGNTNQAGSREGDGVYNKTRQITSIAGLIRPKGL